MGIQLELLVFSLVFDVIALILLRGVIPYWLKGREESNSSDVVEFYDRQIVSTKRFGYTFAIIGAVLFVLFVVFAFL